MDDEFVLGIIERRFLDRRRYSQQEIDDMWDAPVVGPEIGPLVKYDFYHQHDIHCGPNGQYFKNFVPDDEMNKSWVIDDRLKILNYERIPGIPCLFSSKEADFYYTDKVRDELIRRRIDQGYRLQFYTEYMHCQATRDYCDSASSGGGVVFLSKNLMKTINLFNHDKYESFNTYVHMYDILHFAEDYYAIRIGRYAPYSGEFPKDAFVKFLQLFRADGAIAAGADEDGGFYRGALLEALKRMYIYVTYEDAPFDQYTILLAMRIVQEVPPSITPKFAPGRPSCTYDVDLDEFMYFDVRYPNPDGSLNDIYAHRSKKSRESDMSKWIGRPYKPLITSDITLEELYALENRGYIIPRGEIKTSRIRTWDEKIPIKSLFSSKEKYKVLVHNSEYRIYVYIGVTYFDHDGNECDWFVTYGSDEKLNKGYRWLV